MPEARLEASVAHKAGEFYSVHPVKVRERARRIKKQLHHDLELMYSKPVKEWDFEELRRGRPRGPDGTFPRGSAPSWITDITMAEIHKRLQIMTRSELAKHARAALQTFVEIMRDDREDENGRPITPSSVKLDAAKYVMDQIIGKATAKVELSGQLDLNHFLAAVMVNPDGGDAHPVIQGGVAQEEELEDVDE